MADAILVFPPGHAVTNSSGTPVSGAKVSFFDWNTTTGTGGARTVYSDTALTVSLGTTVTCNSAGRPASGGAEVLVYASEGALRAVASDGETARLWAFNDFNGALDTAGFSSSTAKAHTPTTTKTDDYVVTSSDAGYLINVNSTANKTITLPDAATVGDNFTVTIRNINTGRVTIDANGTQTIDGELIQTLINRYESLVLVTDGANWHITAHSTPIPTNRVPVLTIRDRNLSAAPATEGDPGDRYILATAGSGGLVWVRQGCRSREERRGWLD